MNLEQKACDERWASVVGYEGYYEVSNFGNVRSVERLIKCKNRDIVKKSIPRKSHTTKKGYLRVQLIRDGVQSNKFIHTLVAEAFIEKPNNTYSQVNHKNGIKTDNILSNLEWVTPSQNLQHAYDNRLKKSKIKYLIFCHEFKITTYGCLNMEKQLRKIGINKASASSIHRCIKSKNKYKHLNLTFSLIQELF